MAHSPWSARARQPFQSPRQKHKNKPRGERLRPLLEALEDRTLLSATTYLVNLVGDTGTGSGTSGDIRYCINQADNPANAGSTITFGTTALGSNTITLSKGQLVISDNMTITGPGASNLTLSGNNASRVFNISTTTAHVTISGLTIAGGSAAYGGGLYSRGSLTVSGSILSANSASIAGGGICNDGTLTVSVCILADNAAPGCGGGGISNNGSLTLSSSTLTANTAYRGGGLMSSGIGTLTVSNSTLAGNRAAYGGGLWSNGTVTLSGSTLSGNSATSGGGIYNIGNLTVSNSTLSGNSAQYVGGLHNTGGTATLTNATIADNVASVSVGGIDAFAGTVLLHNTLVAGNMLTNSSVDEPFDVAYNLDSGSDYNLIGDGTGHLGTANHNLLGLSAKPLDPLMSTLGNYGGPTQTLALLPGSPAIDAGSSAYGGSTDQRGKPRDGATDIGAFESQGFTIAISSGDKQSANINSAFVQPLVASVSAKNSIEPVAGGRITFTAPASGATAVLKGSPATISSDGKASVTAAANPIGGIYTVNASTTGVTGPANFSLSNIYLGPSLLVTTLLDENNPNDGTTSLHEAIAYAEAQSGPQTITFYPSILTQPSGNIIDPKSALPDLKGNITIEGPGEKILTVQRGPNAAGFRIFTVDAGARAVISGLTITGGVAPNGQGGGIFNSGSLMVNDCTISGNKAGSEGGAIYSSGTLALSGVTLKSNTAQGGTSGNVYGGGLYVAGGTATLTNDTLSNNHAYGGNGASSGGGGAGGGGGNGSGGGLYVAGGTVTLTNDTLRGNNTHGGNGGNGGNQYGIVISSWPTRYGVSGHGGNGGDGGNGSGGGLYVVGGTVTLTNDTLADNNTLGGNGGNGGNGYGYPGHTFSSGQGGNGGNGGTGFGGGLYVAGGTVTLNNDTLGGNNINIAFAGSGGSGASGGGSDGSFDWTGSGGGLDVTGGTVTMTNDTLSSNWAIDGVGGYNGGGLDVTSSGKVLLHNTLIAGNYYSDVAGSLNSASDYNLIGDGSGGLSTANHNLLGINPLLAPMGNYGGPTQTMALLPGSPAIDAGSSSYGGSTDQRGKSRVGATDIGAFESQGFTIAVSSGNNQSTKVNTAFANPLVVSVTANNSIEPVAGGIITFTAPTSGASAVLKGSPATIGSNGKASVTAAANGITGTYTVSASATGIASPAKLSLTNTAAASPTIMLPTPAAPTMATAPSPQETSDQLMSELGQSWDLLLAGDNVQVLTNNPQAGSLAQAIDPNPLYRTQAGALLALAQRIRLPAD